MSGNLFYVRIILLLIISSYNANIIVMGKITESSKFHKGKQKLFSQAGMIAVRTAINNNLPITYAAGNEVIREYPDGRKEVLTVITTVDNKLSKKFVIK